MNLQKLKEQEDDLQRTLDAWPESKREQAYLYLRTRYNLTVIGLERAILDHFKKENPE